MRRTLALMGAVGLATGGLFMASVATAADHAEAPLAAADPAADIADFYAWSDGTTATAIVTFNGLAAAGAPAVYDGDVLYGIHIDYDDDQVADHDIWIRFGQNLGGAWGVQVENLPGGDLVASGAVDTTVTAGNGFELFAGQFEDPFFFDLQGFLDTLATGTLAFTATDAFAGTNATGIVVTMDQAAADGGTGSMAMWATTARL